MVEIPGVPRSTIQDLQRRDEQARGQSSAYSSGNKGFSSAGKRRGGGGGRSRDDASATPQSYYSTVTGKTYSNQNDLLAEELSYKAEQQRQKEKQEFDKLKAEQQQKKAEQLQEGRKVAGYISSNDFTQTRQQKISTMPSLFGATKQSISDLSLEPFSRGVTLFGTPLTGDENFRKNILFTSTGRGTTITEQSVMPSEWKPTTGFSTSEVIGQERVRFGEDIRTTRMSDKAAAEFTAEDISKNIAKDLQSQIDSGGISLEEAQKEYDKKSSEQIDKKLSDLYSSRGRAGAIPKAMQESQDLSKPIETIGTTAGLAIISTNPIGAAGVAGYFGGRGIVDVSGGILSNDWKRIGLGAAEIGLSTLGARQVLGPQTSFIGKGANRVEVPTNMLEAQFRREQFRDILKEKTLLKQVGETKQVESFTERRLVGGRQASGLRQDLDITIRTANVGNKEAVSFGSGTSNIEYKTIFGKRIALPEESFSLQTKFPVTIEESQMSRVGTPFSTGGAGTYGTTTLKFKGQDSFKEIPFVSAGTTTGKDLTIFGGRQTSGKILQNNIQIPSDIVKVSSRGARTEYYNVNIQIPKSVRGKPETIISLKNDIAGIEEGGVQTIYKRTRTSIRDLLGSKQTQSSVDITKQNINLGKASAGSISPVPNTILKTSGLTSTKNLPVLSGGDAFTAMKTTSSKYSGTMTYETTRSQSSFTGPTKMNQDIIFDNLADARTKDTEIVILSSPLAPRIEDRNRGRGGTTTGPVSRLNDRILVGQSPTEFNAQRLDQRMTQRSNLRNTPPFTPPIALITPFGSDFFLPPIKPKIGFDTGISLGKVKGKGPRYAYTPDFRSLILGIRGKAPKVRGGRLTGLEQRPITKGFSWRNIFGGKK